MYEENNSTCHPIKIARFPIQTLVSLIPRLLSVSMGSGYIETGTYYTVARRYEFYF